MRNLESRIQADIVATIRTAAPDCIIFSVPNDGLVSKSQAAKRKWTGVLAGIPDLILIAPGGRTFGIEVKRPGGVVSLAQRQMFYRLNAMGISVAVVHSIAEAQTALAAWGIGFSQSQPSTKLQASNPAMNGGSGGSNTAPSRSSPFA